MKVNHAQLEQIGENWYSRTKKLTSFYQDENKPIEKRLKAFKLSIEMGNRVLHVSNEIMKRISQYPNDIAFKDGSTKSIIWINNKQ